MTPSMPPQPVADMAEDKAPARSRCSLPCSRGNVDTAEVPDLFAALWQEAPFVRLPDDAPRELCELLQDVEDPRRLYSIHRAARRHGFQLLVDRYIMQLRQGCGSSQCSTATCFTTRKRLAGKAPLRRYSPTSARMLAVYLASKDNPDESLCPHLRRYKTPSPATNTLIFSSSTRKVGSSQQPACSERRRPPQSPPLSADDAPSVQRLTDAPPQHHHQPSSKHTISEIPVKRDHRSFSAAVFGTVAFKMLEWLTPIGVSTISRGLRHGKPPQQTARLDGDESCQDPSSSPSAKPLMQALDAAHSEAAHRPCNEDNANAHKHEEDKSIKPGEERIAKQDERPLKHDDEKSLKQQVDKSLRTEAEGPLLASSQGESQGEEVTPSKASSMQIHSAGSLRASPGANTTNRRSSLDSPPPTAGKDDSRLAPKSTPRSNLHSDVRPRAARIAPAVLNRSMLAPPSKPAFFETINYRSPALDQVSTDGVPDCKAIEGDADAGASEASPVTSRTNSPGGKESVTSASEQDLSESYYVLPQTLCRLNVDVIEFICNTFLQDWTWETHSLGSLLGQQAFPGPLNMRNKLARQLRPGHAVSKSQWQAFNHQALFDVLSNPHALVQSFTQDGKLFDSLTIWYCMIRLTRVVPSLVFHSLWMAAKSLFVAPSSLKHLRSKTEIPFAEEESALTNFEAGCVMSICFHALVAAAPRVSDSKTIKDMSHLRSQGLILPDDLDFSQEATALCLEYNDVFSNELALRLAKRLFCAILTRRCYADMAKSDPRNEGKRVQRDILRPLLGHINSLKGENIRILEFGSSERIAHEVRVPILLLDWARTILRQYWNGEAVFTCDGPFYGALSLMATMHENQSLLMLKEEMFRFDYLSERLNPIDMPVDWVQFTSTKQRRHLLDFPFLFNPGILVTYFRSINFAPMCSYYEEASSLRSRMAAIVDPGSLVTNPHHKKVLQDSLKTASSRYLVLEVRRDFVVQDAWDQLWRRERRELMRPLKVHLGEDTGEEGFDSGGVQQEFLRMAMAECLDPKYGAFTVDERTQMTWFVPGSLVEEWQFQMVGLLVSLAVYNGLTLPVTFPKALYCKLLGHGVTKLVDIGDGWPELTNGLTQLSEWDEERGGLIEDVFARTYEFSVASHGKEVTRQMTSDERATWPQGLEGTSTSKSAASADEAPLVTAANRDAYVHDYVRYLTDVSVRPQYQAFERGFQTCLSTKSLSLLTPSNLQSLVEGMQEIDVHELRKYARYIGWTPSHRCIRDFWSVVKRYDHDMKRRLLEFVTSSDRVPVGGMRNLQFVVQRNGEESAGGRLPTAYTCYGTLLLPEYSDKEVLRERLGMALQNAQGFGFA
ncbi:hypothetical protein CDD82_1993 [Ophiocordyceps australis]|uniref:HECT-type E3 ubiquitin transferase n=1 Tax=Ophiocordyceps australis TaxID=1399860 RepID=A0A2C5ZL94_9HYPO|nr:hypothetical protein CDD82_1993 [Ophiocordyceps australis]